MSKDKKQDRDKGLCNCGMESENVTDHLLSCPYRLAYDSLQVSIMFDEAKILALLFFLARMQACDYDLFMANSGVELQEAVQSAVKELADLRNGLIADANLKG